MKFRSGDVGFFRGQIMIPVPKHYEEQADKLMHAIANGKQLDIEIKIHREHRSLNANAALWAMLNDMADVLKTTADELYIEELRKYGVSKFMAVLPEDVERISREYRWAVERRSYTLNGVPVKALQVWPGSSTYDTAEFARLFDGVISDAKELGVDFLPAADRDFLLKEWGERHGPSV